MAVAVASGMDAAKRYDFAFKTFFVCVVLGIVGNILIRDTVWGIGFAAFALVVFGAGALLAKQKPAPLTRGAMFACLGAVGFALLFGWRDSGTLKILNAFAVFMLLGLAAFKTRGGDLRIGTIADYPFRVMGKVFGFIGDAFHLASLEGGWNRIGQERGGKFATALLRGLLLALPLVLIFGGLFAAADASFEKMVTGSLVVQPNEVATGILVTFGCAVIIGGLFRRLFLAEPGAPPVEREAAPAPFGAVEIGIAFGALNLLFALFVATQFRHFFGGQAVIDSTAGLGYAQYARRGFFELATAALLVLPVLLGGHALIARKGPVAGKVYSVMSAILIGLVFVVIASAENRMRMYVGAYGISELRMYVLASIAWIAAVFAWFAATVLRSRPQHFAFGALMLILVGIFGMNVSNPDAVIARINTTRGSQLVDVAYLANLSADAVPELQAALPRLQPEQRAWLEKDLAARKQEMNRSDWRSWTIGRGRAMSALRGAVDAGAVARRE